MASTRKIALSTQGHLKLLIEDLLLSGWRIESIPEDGKIPRNGIKLVLQSGDVERRLRVFAYKVTSSGRSRPHERRVEITTTYISGLVRLTGFSDAVLGIDTGARKYVGIDSRRLRLGGSTHNASSFFDREGLSVSKGRLLINPRAVKNTLFSNGIELHAFFDQSRLSEYLFNQSEIHAGMYAFGGLFGGATPPRRDALKALNQDHKAKGDSFVIQAKPRRAPTRVRANLIEAVEEGDASRIERAGLSPEQLRRIQDICNEIGALGEQAVLVRERSRLRRLGHKKQAERVERVSLKSVSLGYDILSFEDDGITKRYIEVKATSGEGSIVDISLGEWRAAAQLRNRYYLVRVINTRAAPKLFYVRNPIEKERIGLIVRTPTGWRIDLRAAMRVN